MNKDQWVVLQDSRGRIPLPKGLRLGSEDDSTALWVITRGSGKTLVLSPVVEVVTEPPGHAGWVEDERDPF